MPEPLLNALLMADRIVTEDNGKKVIVGVFSKFNIPQFPAQVAPWFLFAAVENLEDHNTFTFNLARADTQEVVFSAGGEIQVQDPTSGVEIVLPVPPIVFRSQGLHVLQFLVNGHVLISRNLPVNLVGTR
jgi:hypothetical protein